MLGILLSCAGHQSPCRVAYEPPDVVLRASPPPPPRILPEHAWQNYGLYVDENIPEAKLEQATEGWSHVEPRFHFFYYFVPHEEAVHRANYLASSHLNSIGIIYIAVDDKDNQCGDDVEIIACYAYPGVIWLQKDKLDTLMVWDKVIAHELGHAFGLAHDSDTANSIMRPHVGWDIDAPTSEDAAALHFDSSR